MKERNIFASAIISDDDNVMRAHLQHKKNKPKEKAKLSVWVYAPEFLADPGHQKKSVGKYFYTLASLPASKFRVNNTIAKRMKKLGLYDITK